MMVENYIALDLETTGFEPKEDHILEIGAVRVCSGRITERFERLIDPHRPVPTHITDLTGITDEMVAGACELDDAMRELQAFCQDLPILGHNIRFDCGFLCQAAQSAELSFAPELLDTLAIARRALPDLESRSLEALCGYYGIARDQAHRALSDVLDTVAVYQRLALAYGASHPEWFATVPFRRKAEKQEPITAPQKRYLSDLLRYHGMTLEREIDSLKKSEASRIIDEIIRDHGKIGRKWKGK